MKQTDIQDVIDFNRKVSAHLSTLRTSDQIIKYLANNDLFVMHINRIPGTIIRERHSLKLSTDYLKRHAPDMGLATSIRWAFNSNTISSDRIDTFMLKKLVKGARTIVEKRHATANMYLNAWFDWIDEVSLVDVIAGFRDVLDVYIEDQIRDHLLTPTERESLGNRLKAAIAERTTEQTLKQAIKVNQNTLHVLEVTTERSEHYKSVVGRIGFLLPNPSTGELDKYLFHMTENRRGYESNMSGNVEKLFAYANLDLAFFNGYAAHASCRLNGWYPLSVDIHDDRGDNNYKYHRVIWIGILRLILAKLLAELRSLSEDRNTEFNNKLVHINNTEDETINTGTVIKIDSTISKITNGEVRNGSVIRGGAVGATIEVGPISYKAIAF